MIADPCTGKMTGLLRCDACGGPGGGVAYDPGSPPPRLKSGDLDPLAPRAGRWLCALCDAKRTRRATSDDGAFLILHQRSVGPVLLFWGPDRGGYTNDFDAAGRYTREEAIAIQRNRPELDRAVPEALLVPYVRRYVSDGDVLEILEAAAAAIGP